MFKESVRDRVPYAMVVFAVLLMAASYLISQLTAGQDMKIIKDLGLAALSIFGLLIAVFIGIGLVSKEVEKKSVFGLLSKPVTRPQFILGKYAGLVMTLAVNLGVMTVALLRRARLHGLRRHRRRRAPAWPAPAMDPRLLIAIGLIFAELMLVTAVALFFSTYLESAAGDAAHARPVGRRPLQRRPAEFRDASSTPRPSPRSRARCITCCRTSRRSTSRPKWCYGMPVAMRHVLYTLGVRARLHHHPADGGGGDFPPPRFQVMRS